MQAGKVRVEADELTYPLHIILRYEIEEGLISGKIPGIEKGERGRGRGRGREREREGEGERGTGERRQKKATKFEQNKEGSDIVSFIISLTHI